jgi:hypothetical protein
MNTTTAAQGFIAAAALIARDLVAHGATPEAAANIAADTLFARMVTERPELAAKVLRSAMVAA